MYDLVLCHHIFRPPEHRRIISIKIGCFDFGPFLCTIWSYVIIYLQKRIISIKIGCFDFGPFLCTHFAPFHDIFYVIASWWDRRTPQQQDQWSCWPIPLLALDRLDQHYVTIVCALCYVMFSLWQLFWWFFSVWGKFVLENHWRFLGVPVSSLSPSNVCVSHCIVLALFPARGQMRTWIWY